MSLYLAFRAPIVTTQVISPTSIRVTFTQPSGPPAEKYDIQSIRVIGVGQDLCRDRNNPNDTMTASGVASPYDITNLQEFSSYNITVTAIFPGSMMLAKTVRNTTSAAGTVIHFTDMYN